MNDLLNNACHGKCLGIASFVCPRSVAFQSVDSQGGHRKVPLKGERVRNMEGNPNCVTAEGMLILLVLLAEGFSF